jgi:hypothetical protein
MTFYPSITIDKTKLLAPLKLLPEKHHALFANYLS